MATTTRPALVKPVEKETKSPSDRATIRSPFVFLSVSGNSGRGLLLSTASLIFRRNGAGGISLACSTGPNLNGVPIAAKVLFQDSTASSTNGILGSFAAVKIGMEGIR